MESRELNALDDMLPGLHAIGVTGLMGSGKSTFCRSLITYANAQADLDEPLYHADLDAIVHSVYAPSSPYHARVTADIRATFGDAVFDGELVNRKRLGKAVFGDDGLRQKLAEAIIAPTLDALEDSLRAYVGTALIDAAYFTEYGLLPIVRNRIVLVHCDDETRIARTMARDNLPRDDVLKRMASQQCYTEKKEIIEQTINRDGYGSLYEVDNSAPIDYAAALRAIQMMARS